MNIIDSDLLSIQEARVRAEEAQEARLLLQSFSQARLDHAIDLISQGLVPVLASLAKRSAEETDFGRWEDKLMKNRFVTETLPRRMAEMPCVGVIQQDQPPGTFTIGVPRGPVLALLNASSPVSTMIYLAFIAIKSGNPIIFYPHRRAAKVSQEIFGLLDEWAEKAGLPMGTLAMLEIPSDAGVEALLQHEAIAVIINSGVPRLRKACKASGKIFLDGTMGNNPVFVEKTADIAQAAKDIVASKSFDCGVLPGVEQSVVVDIHVAAELKQAMQEAGAYFMDGEEARRLADLCFDGRGRYIPEFVGKSAAVLAKRAQIDAPAGTKILVAEEPYVSQKSLYAREKLGPILAWYIEEDWQHACEKCIELLISESEGHSLAIFSKDDQVIQQFAIKKPVGRLLVNTPCAFGAVGMTTNLFPAMTLGGVSRHGITADNISPRNLIYRREVGTGVRDIAPIREACGPEGDEKACQWAFERKAAASDIDADTLYQVFKQFLDQS